jgi:hypothetical protein
MTLVDANVFLDVFTADDAWKNWSQGQLKTLLLGGGAAINPIIYAEVSLAFAHERELEAELRALGITRLPLPYDAAFPAGRALVRYRREGGQGRSPLPDFYIGAHAQVAGLTLLTRDARRYRAYFPSVAIIAPAI